MIRQNEGDRTFQTGGVGKAWSKPYRGREGQGGAQRAGGAEGRIGLEQQGPQGGWTGSRDHTMRALVVLGIRVLSLEQQEATGMGMG